jgi:hypothetical protein
MIHGKCLTSTHYVLVRKKEKIDMMHFKTWNAHTLMVVLIFWKCPHEFLGSYDITKPTHGLRESEKFTKNLGKNQKPERGRK